MKNLYLGLGKTIFNTSVTLVEPTGKELDIEMLLSERIIRAKHSGAWPMKGLEYLYPKLQEGKLTLGESRDVGSVSDYEDAMDRSFPFYALLKKKKLDHYSRHFNPSLQSFGHHLAHAYAAMALSPFEDALIVVMDGAGSSKRDLISLGQDLAAIPQAAIPESYEYASTYDLKDKTLTCLQKDFLQFRKSKKHQQTFANGIGLFYEKISEFIFNSKHEAGKVMGLAPFGKRMLVMDDYISFLEELDWEKQFRGKSKAEWEQSPFMSYYQDLAATAQAEYEDYLTAYLRDLKRRFPQKKNVILTGGCALNCTANWKVVERNIFEHIYVTPFPGDESIGLGCAIGVLLQENSEAWRPLPFEQQNSFWGPKESPPKMRKVADVFSEFTISIEPDVARKVALELYDKKVVAWFQGRSECGPRALGHRSILARPDREDLKDYLNEHIKFRESFRPYGCTCIWEKAHRYFDVPEGFENPFMSFAVPVKETAKDILRHVTHVDGTSRMQTLHREQEPLFYRLLLEVEKLTGHPILLNTSLNVMGEPVLETIEDALRFFQSSPVDALVIGPAWITRK